MQKNEPQTLRKWTSRINQKAYRDQQQNLSHINTPHTHQEKLKVNMLTSEQLETCRNGTTALKNPVTNIQVQT
jgi:hypothetical protein